MLFGSDMQKPDPNHFQSFPVANVLEGMIMKTIQQGCFSGIDRTRIEEEESDQVRRGSMPEVFCIANLRITCPPDIYHPELQSSSMFLLRHLDLEFSQPEPKILEVGVGSGAVLLSLADKFKSARCVGTDIDHHALETARYNALANGLEVDFRLSDLFSAIGPEEKFDAVIFNPPLFDKAPASALERQALCDPGGKLLARYLQMVGNYIRPGGAGYCVASNIGNLTAIKGMCQQPSLIAAELFSSGQVLGLLKIEPS